MEANLYQIIAIAIASFSVGMNVGRLMVIGKKDTRERRYKSRTLPQHRPPVPPPKPK